MIPTAIFTKPTFNVSQEKIVYIEFPVGEVSHIMEIEHPDNQLWEICLKTGLSFNTDNSDEVEALRVLMAAGG